MNGITILQGDCRETLKTLPDNSVHCCVTSPPYFGLRDYGCEGQIGLEASPRDFIDQMVAVFREVRRVLRDDGTLWLNLGDSYAGSWGAQGRPQGDGDMKGRSVTSARQIGSHPRFDGLTGARGKEIGLKPKDLMGIPWRVAFALQEDGWWLRSEIIWHKPNPMPESVNDRPTKSHEQIFLLSKSSEYYYDAEAIKEDSLRPEGSGNKARKAASERGVPVLSNGTTNGAVAGSVPWQGESRNKRTVWTVSDDEYQQFLHWKEMQETQKSDLWTVSTKPYRGAHFATFPPDLIQPCILAGTSEHGACAKCGAPWERVTEKDRKPTRPGNKTKIGRVSDDDGSPYENHSGMIVGNRDPQRHITVTKTTGWQPTCQCGTEEVVPCVVLDPFGGSGTTGEVARDSGCHAILCELNPKYVSLIEKRLEQGSLLV